MRASGYQQYKNQSVSTMTQGEMLLLLFDELVKRITRAELALKDQDNEVFDQSINRAAEIIKYLKRTLNREYAISVQYGSMNEIFKTTQEMQDALSRDDRVSLEMLISMRQNEIDLAVDCDRDIQYLLSVLTPEKREQVRDWLNHGSARERDGFEAVKVFLMLPGVGVTLAAFVYFYEKSCAYFGRKRSVGYLMAMKIGIGHHS